MADSRRIRANGIDIHYLREGKGPPCSPSRVARVLPGVGAVHGRALGSL
jgi:hypothetical protein